jgi:hypothetical protein
MDHSPIQIDLATKLGARDIADRALAELRDRRKALAGRFDELASAAAAAKATLAEAAGAQAAGESDDAKAIDKARKALRAAESEYELTEIELQGVDARIAKAERERGSKHRDACLVGSDICRVAVDDLEEQARDTFERFAEIMRERHRLAKLAGILMTEASGRFAEPIAYSSETCGLLRRGMTDEGLLGVLTEHGLSPTFSPLGALEPATVGELLEIDLPPQQKAAAE